VLEHGFTVPEAQITAAGGSS
jgi:hypothetical protein